MFLNGGYTGRSVLDPQLATFLQEGLSIHIGTRDGTLQPAGARAAAIKVESDGRHLVVYLPEVAAPRLLADLENNGQAAISVGRPVDDRACQVKGTLVDVRPAAPDERALVAEQWEGFMRQLELIGIPRAMAAGWSMWPALAVRLKVTAVFEQTPRPGTGYAIA
jgi:hypothetical protein